MFTVRKASDRGHADHGWLNTYHTFSFAGYQDRKHMGFSNLRVMNEDRVAPGKGFGTHAHENMEIISYVLEGSLEHKDSMGNGEVLTPGEFQRITAGSGITHSEFNPSETDPVHFYQIWIIPNAFDLQPDYEQRRFDKSMIHNRLGLVASADGRSDSITIHADADVFLSKLDKGQVIESPLESHRYIWIQVLRGSAEIASYSLETSDGLGIINESDWRMVASSDCELMVFDLPKPT